MHADRRQFLKFFGLTISAVATGKLKSIVLADNYYCNRKLGLRFVIPDEWQILSYEQYSDIMDEGQLDFYDESLERELKNNIGTPLIAMQAPIKSKGHVYPTIHIWAQPNTRPEVDPVIVHTESYEWYGDMFKDYEILHTPSSTLFANHNASYCRVRFKSETKDGHSEPVSLDSYLFPRGPIGYTVNFADHEINGWNEKTKSSFKGFLGSIEFALQ